MSEANARVVDEWQASLLQISDGCNDETNTMCVTDSVQSHGTIRSAVSFNLCVVRSSSPHHPPPVV